MQSSVCRLLHQGSHAQRSYSCYASDYLSKCSRSLSMTAGSSSMMMRPFSSSGSGRDLRPSPPDTRAKSPSKSAPSSAATSSSFRPRRHPHPEFRPLKKAAKDALKQKQKARVTPAGINIRRPIRNEDDEFIADFGPMATSLIHEIRQDIKYAQDEFQEDPIERELRMADYYTSEIGSTEDLVGERRGLAMLPESPEEIELFKRQLDMAIAEAQDDIVFDSDEEEDDEHDQRRKLRGEEIESDEDDDDDEEEDYDEFEREERDFDDDDPHVDDDEKDPETHMDPNQLVHGEWSELLVDVGRTVTLWRGGRLEGYRALVVGGNLNGCGGFGLGKAENPVLAVDFAARMCKRNIFFVSPYQGNGLTRDLVGKQNSCKVYLRATDSGLRGNELIREILKRFGITNCVAKSHGNRNPYNVVRATFKALMTHESIEEIALKRGKRLVSLDRAMRMQV